MDEETLKEIEARYKRAQLTSEPAHLVMTADDNPALVAEVRRLRLIVECRTYCCEPHMQEIARLRGLLERWEADRCEMRDWRDRAVQFIQSGYPQHDHNTCACRRCELISEVRE